MESKPGMESKPERLNMGRTLKIGLFHIGSAFPDILLSAVWNRILITELGLSAGLVAILAALRYMIAPLSIWSGNRSDTHPIMGKHRLPYIWGGRLISMPGLLLIPTATLFLVNDPKSWVGWLLAALCYMISGSGALISGSPYMALIRDSAPPTKRGQAMSIAQIMMLFSVAMVPGIYAQIIPSYDQGKLWMAALIGIGLASPFWFFSILGEDRGPVSVDTTQETLPFTEVFRNIWGDPRARTFFIFLSLGMICAFAQDTILEPFGGDVFNLSVKATTSWNMDWGLGVLVGMIGGTVYTRKRAPHQHTSTTVVGLVLSMISLGLMGAAAVMKLEAAMIPVLVLFGFGFGIQSVGTINLIMAMTSDKNAGSYLGLWSLAQIVFRGVGMAIGGIMRDVVLSMTHSLPIAYGSVFFAESLGFIACIMLLLQVDVAGFVHKAPVPIHDQLAALGD